MLFRSQDWLSVPLEHQSNRQAAWRTDPALAGPAGCLGDIGTHAYQLAEFVTGQRPSEVSASSQSSGTVISSWMVTLSFFMANPCC